MTSATDTFTDAVTDLTRRSQEITTAAVRTWADAVQQAYAGFPAPALPGVTTDVTTAVDRWFDVAQQVLDHQRTFAHQFVTAGTQAAGAFSEQARTVTAQVVTATEQATATTRATNGTAPTAPTAADATARAAARTSSRAAAAK